MSGVYGSLLEEFSELFRPVKFWDMDAKLNGFGPKYNEQEINVIVIDDIGDAIVRKHSAAVDYMMLDTENNDVLYSYEDSPIARGQYLLHPDDMTIHRVVTCVNHSFPGGFNVWGIQRVQGANGENAGELKMREAVF